MIEEQAVVIAAEKGFAWVETQRQSACGQCSANKGCGTAVLSKALGGKRTQIKVLDEVGVKPGETVVLGLDESAMLKGSAILYLLPLAGLFLFSVLAQWLIQPVSEGPTVLAGLLGLAFGFYLLKLQTSNLAADSRYQPVVLRRVIPVRSSIDGVFPA